MKYVFFLRIAKHDKAQGENITGGKVALVAIKWKTEQDQLHIHEQAQGKSPKQPYTFFIRKPGSSMERTARRLER